MSNNDFVDQAMDAAEAKMADNAVAVVDKEVQAAEVEHVEREETTQSSRERDESGKFVSKQTKTVDENTPQVLDQTANAELSNEQTVVNTAPAINPPAFWTNEHKALFLKAPAGLQEVIAQRELTLQQQLSRAANEGQRGRAFEQRMYEGWEPQEIQAHRAKLGVSGLRDEVDELRRYRDWNTVFENDPYTGIYDLMRKNGLTPYDFIQNGAGYDQQPQYVQTDPELEQTVVTLQQELEAIKANAAANEEAQFLAVINNFKAGKDSAGRVRKEFAEMYAPHITQAQSQLTEMYPHLSFDELLHHAYEHVLAKVNELHGVKNQPVQAKQTAIANAKKAQGAATTSVGSPRTEAITQKPRARTIDEALDRAEEQVYGR